MARVFTRAPGAAATTASGNSGALQVHEYNELAVDISVTAVAGTTPNMALFLERQGTDGVWYPIWSPTAITAATTLSVTVSANTPAGTSNVQHSFGDTARLRWAITGTNPSFTWSGSIKGK